MPIKRQRKKPTPNLSPQPKLRQWIIRTAMDWIELRHAAEAPVLHETATTKDITVNKYVLDETTGKRKKIQTTKPFVLRSWHYEGGEVVKIYSLDEVPFEIQIPSLGNSRELTKRETVVISTARSVI